MADINAFKLTYLMDDPEVYQKLLRKAGMGFGLVFSLGFALLTWGFDALQLSLYAVALPWVKIAFGLPFAVILGMLVGWGAAWSNSTAFSIMLWVIGGWFLGFLAGHVPFDGNNFAAWLLDRRLMGETIFVFGDSAAGRTMLLAVLNAFFGVMIGLGESFAIQVAWDRTTSDKKMGWESWAVLAFVGLPLAIVPSTLTNSIINHPLRTPQTTVGDIIHLALSEHDETALTSNPDYRSIKPFRASFTGNFQIHLVSFGSEPSTWESAYVDVVFDNGFVLRCTTQGMDIIFCDDFSEKLASWSGDLVHAGLSGERPWLDTKVRSYTVEESVVAWFSTIRDQLSESFEVSRHKQFWGWVFMAIHFDTGLEVMCRFRGAAPVRVDQCVEAAPTCP